MKLLFITGFLTLSFLQMNAQVTSGKIFYDETIKMNIDLKDMDIKGEGVSADMIAAMLPKEHSAKKVLYFNTNAALYDVMKTESTDATKQSGNMQMVINFSGNDSKTYRDLKENKLIEQKDFMSRKFLVTSDAPKNEWKMTGKQKAILDYPCQQATMMKDTQTVTAWFTPAIPVSAGPGGSGGLPGMILEMQVGNSLSYIATKAEAGDIDAKMLSKPSEGKKVTKEQYKKIMDGKMKEMGATSQGGNNIIIRTDIRH